MDPLDELNIHKSRIEILLQLLPLAYPRFSKVLFFKKENKLNSFISDFVSKYYILDLLENEDRFKGFDLYRDVCQSYDYILNVVDNASVVYDKSEVQRIKERLNLK